MQSIPTLCAFLCLIPLIADARIGESLTDCVKRYGEPSAESQDDGVYSYHFKKNGYEIQVVMIGGKVVDAINYSKPFENSSGFENDIITKEETDILLDANRNGSSWLAEKKNGNWFFWKTKDKKLTADYGISRILNIQISDFWKKYKAIQSNYRKNNATEDLTGF